MWQGIITFAVGLWLIASGIRVDFESQTNLIVCGIIVLVFGFAAYKNWQGIFVGILGIITILLAFTVTNTPRVDVIYYTVGSLVIILSLLSAFKNEWQHLLE
jgi:hypothetical protein